jgi:hypothetical protein
LLSFQGKQADNSAILNWYTTYEQNSNLFIIEKSIDGRNFSSIGTVNAKGTSFNVNGYYFTDKNLEAINYYRLKMVETDGKTTFSQIVVIQHTNGRKQVTVLNNPFHSTIDLRFTQKAQLVQLQLVQANGVIVEAKTFRNPGERLHWNLLNTSLQNGSYLLRITSDEKTYIYKLIKD